MCVSYGPPLAKRMKKGYACPITKRGHTLLSQRTWRTVGLVTLGLCAVLAWYGARPGVTALPLHWLAVYWGVFLLTLLVTLYMVLLDLSYIRLTWLQGEKELFDDTLGSEAFRSALRNRPPAPSPPADPEQKP